MLARRTCKILKVPSNFYRYNQKIRLITRRPFFYNNINNNGINRRSMLFARAFHEKQQPDHQSGGAAAYEGAFTKIWRNLFGKYLFATNVISSGVLMVVGDVIAQFIEMRGVTDANFDYPRVWRMFIVGAVQGPLHHWVYAWMDRVMPVPTISNVMKKILIDQLFMSPVCILLFYYTACYLEKKCLKETHAEIVDKFPLIYAFDWLLWPGAQYVNFRYLDTKYRVFFVNVCTALYNIFISYIKHEGNIPHIGTIATASNTQPSAAASNEDEKAQQASSHHQHTNESNSK